MPRQAPSLLLQSLPLVRRGARACFGRVHSLCVCSIHRPDLTTCITYTIQTHLKSLVQGLHDAGNPLPPLLVGMAPIDDRQGDGGCPARAALHSRRRGGWKATATWTQQRSTSSRRAAQLVRSRRCMPPCCYVDVQEGTASCQSVFWSAPNAIISKASSCLDTSLDPGAPSDSIK